MYALAATWETAENRSQLKSLITGLVGYPCQLSCQPNNGAIDIYVFSIEKRRVTDWLEIQPSGAIGLCFDMYEGESKGVQLTADRCDEYNDSIDAAFRSDSDSECYSSTSVSESEEESGEESGESEK